MPAVLLLDAHNQIVFANAALRDRLQDPRVILTGQPVETLSTWLDPALLAALQCPPEGHEHQQTLSLKNSESVDVTVSQEDGTIEITLLPAAPLSEASASANGIDILATHNPNERTLAIWHAPATTSEGSQNSNESSISAAWQQARGAAVSMSRDEWAGLWSETVPSGNHAWHALEASAHWLQAAENLAELRGSLGLHTDFVEFERDGRPQLTGTPATLPAWLAAAAPDKSIWATEFWLLSLLKKRPTDWEMLEQVEAPMPSTDLRPDGVAPLPDWLRGRRLLIGPGVRFGRDALLVVEYAHSLTAEGINGLLPILSVRLMRRPEAPLPLSPVRNRQRGATDSTTSPTPPPVRSSKTREKPTPEPTLPAPTPVAESPAPPPTPEPEPAPSLESFKKLELLSDAPWAETWRAVDPAGNLLCLKIFKPGYERLAEGLRERAAQLQKPLHPRIASLIRVETKAAPRFALYTYAPGRTLHYWQRQTPLPIDASAPPLERLAPTLSATTGPAPTTTTHPLPLEWTLDWALELAEALEAAHRSRLLHLDLKPSNIVIGPDGKPTIVGFGLALTPKHAADHPPVATAFAETVAYMAPERARAQGGVSATADIYSLAAIVYELLTGKTPFHPSGDFTADVEALQAHRPTNPGLLRLDVPDTLSAALLKALDSKPDRRFASMNAFAQTLRRIRGRNLSTKKTKAPGTKGPRFPGLRALLTPRPQSVFAQTGKQRRNPRRALLLAGVVIVAGLVALSLHQRKEQRDALIPVQPPTQENIQVFLPESAPTVSEPVSDISQPEDILPTTAPTEPADSSTSPDAAAPIPAATPVSEAESAAGASETSGDSQDVGQAILPALP